MRVEELKKLVVFARRIIVALIITNVITIGFLIADINNQNQNELMRKIAIEECLPDETPTMDLPPLEVIEEELK